MAGENIVTIENKTHHLFDYLITNDVYRNYEGSHRWGDCDSNNSGCVRRKKGRFKHNEAKQHLHPFQISNDERFIIKMVNRVI